MNWRGLLVSVRNAAEAAEALDGGAAIIDVKEPRHGPLGAAEPEAIAAVARVVGTRRPWTMACGELGGDAADESVAGSIRSRFDRMLALLGGSAVPPAAVKIGLAGAAGTDWQRRLLALFESLPAGSDRVAVAYADWQQAGAPSPPEVIAAAAGLNVGGSRTGRAAAGGRGWSHYPGGNPVGMGSSARCGRVAIGCMLQWQGWCGAGRACPQCRQPESRLN